MKRTTMHLAVVLALAGSAPLALAQTTGPSSSQSPYLTPFTDNGVSFTSILTTGDTVGAYRMVGIPDGLGAYDNGNGTITVLMDHALASGASINRAHQTPSGVGSAGARC